MKRRRQGAADAELMSSDDCILSMKMQAYTMAKVASLDEVVSALATTDELDPVACFPGVLLGKQHALCKVSSIQYAEDSTQEIYHNDGVGHTFAAVEHVHEFWNPETLTRLVKVNGGVCLEAYMETCIAYTASDNGGAAHLNFGAKLKILGGWAKTFEPVNCTPSQSAQQRSVFHVNAANLNALRKRSTAYDKLAVSSEALVRQYVLPRDDAEKGDGEYTLAAIDILFQHSRSVHFTNHTDTEASGYLVKELVLTVVWLISPNGSSSMRVAGADKAAEMNRPGEGHLFVSDMYHRTDVTTVGTVKVTCFFRRPPQAKRAQVAAKAAMAAEAAEAKATPPQEPHETEQGEHATAVQTSFPSAKHEEAGNVLDKTGVNVVEEPAKTDEEEERADTTSSAKGASTAPQELQGGHATAVQTLFPSAKHEEAADELDEDEQEGEQEGEEGEEMSDY
jgi:hypothetical protein